MNNDQLIQFLDSLKTDVINSMQANGTIGSGQTIQQILIVQEDDKLQLQLPDYLMALENGRSPTGKNAIPGNPPMIQRIQAWCQAKGISGKLAWAIKKSIDKKGYPGKPGIISGPLSTDNINSRLDPALNDMAASATEELAAAIPK
jgi:hypothetical protein